ncbi:MAG: UDP-2,4-diacetamido-2,4,6-trideoxy-beta-L-altropyranose hydrolase [Cyanobacteria bacterium J06648_16]
MRGVLFRADASPEIGTGHVMRCLALAQVFLQAQKQVLFLAAAISPALVERLQQEGIRVLRISAHSGSPEDARLLTDNAKAADICHVVVDGYQFDETYQTALKSAGLKVLFIDDYGHAATYSADWVLNQNVYAHDQLYSQRKPHTKLLLGSRYALLRKEFWPWRGWPRLPTAPAQKVLVTLGGGDPDNVTLKVLLALQQVKSELDVIIIVGSSNPHLEILQQQNQSTSQFIRLRHNVTDMPALMAWADIAISAGGSTCWELAFMGLPTLMIVVADNQKRIVESLDTLGVGISLGWHDALTPAQIKQALESLLNTTQLRLRMMQSGRSLIDGIGSHRVANQLGLDVPPSR